MEDSTGSPISPGDIVAGKYHVDRVLGQGGMGVVVAATHQHLDQKVALKFLLPAVSSHPEIVQRFLREARAAVKIQSEHVARVLDVGTLDNGTPYMVMEYLEGQDMAQVLADRGPLPIDETVGYLLQACEALAEAHSLGIVHRDLKPANMFLARKPTGKPMVKVLDFGISKIPAGERDVLVTQATSIMGSPGYMSPEQMTSAAAVDARSDVWSLGVVLYELLAGKLPFRAETMPEMVAAILTKPHVPLATMRGDIPVGLQAVVDHCLEKDPSRRFPNVAELARAIAPFGPPRSEHHVERIEHLLGLKRESVQPAATDPSLQMRRPDNLTFSPMTSQASGGNSRLIVPGVIAGVIVVGTIAFFALRPFKSAAALATPSASDVPPVPSASVAAAASSVAPVSSPASSPVTLTTLPPPTPQPPQPPVPGQPIPRPQPKPSAAPSAPAAPTCHVVSYFDADGNKHFKQECP